MQYLMENSRCFTPWLVHQYVNKQPLQWFSGFLQSADHVNVAINKLDEKCFSTCFSLFLR